MQEPMARWLLNKSKCWKVKKEFVTYAEWSSLVRSLCKGTWELMTPMVQNVTRVRNVERHIAIKGTFKTTLVLSTNKWRSSHAQSVENNLGGKPIYRCTWKRPTPDGCREASVRRQTTMVEEKDRMEALAPRLNTRRGTSALEPLRCLGLLLSLSEGRCQKGGKLSHVKDNFQNASAIWK